MILLLINASHCEARRLAKGKSSDDENKRRSQSIKNDDDENNGDDDWGQIDGSFSNNRECFETDDAFPIENKHLMFRCSEVSFKRYACSWHDVRRNCPCSCRNYSSHNNDYDDVYNYEDIGGEGIEVCSDVNHPFNIFKDYQKVLVYCSDLEKQEYNFACQRDRPKKKCPVICQVCNPIDDHSYIDYVYNDDHLSNGGVDESACTDISSQFPITHNTKQAGIRCFNLLQKEFSYACTWNKVKQKCPLTCGVCSPNNDSNNNNSENNPSCHDTSNQFQVSINNEQVSIRCFNLLQNELRYTCKIKNVQHKCPVTCGVCSSGNGNDNDNRPHTYGNKDDDYNYDYNDDYTHGYRGNDDDDNAFFIDGSTNDIVTNHGYNSNNVHYIFSDDDFNIVYLDDQLY